MKKGTKFLALGLSFMLSVGLLAGCGNTANGSNQSDVAGSSNSNNSSTTSGRTYNGIDISEHIDLKMYLLGDRTPDFDEVYGEINKILEEKLNCSLSVDFLSWGEHDTKYSLLFSSSEDFDLIFTSSSWVLYDQTVSLGVF